MTYKDVIETIIGCACCVYNKMGLGERKFEVKPEFPRVVICEKNLES